MYADMGRPSYHSQTAGQRWRPPHDEEPYHSGYGEPARFGHVNSLGPYATHENVGGSLGTQGLAAQANDANVVSSAAAVTADSVTERLREVANKINAVAGLYSASHNAQQLTSQRPVPTTTRKLAKVGDEETVRRLVEMVANLSEAGYRYFAELSASGIAALQKQASWILQSTEDSDELVRALPSRRQGSSLGERQLFAWQEVAQCFRRFCTSLSIPARKFVALASGEEMLVLRERAQGLLVLQQQRAAIELKLAAKKKQELIEAEKRAATEAAEAASKSLQIQFAGNAMAVRGVERARARFNDGRFRKRAAAELQLAIEEAKSQLPPPPPPQEEESVPSKENVLPEGVPQPVLSRLQHKLLLKRQAALDSSESLPHGVGLLSAQTSAGAKLRVGLSPRLVDTSIRAKEFERRLKQQALFDQFDALWLHTLEKMYPAVCGHEVIKTGRLIDTRDKQRLCGPQEICDGVARGINFVLLKSGIWCPGPTLLYLANTADINSQPMGELPLCGVVCRFECKDGLNDKDPEDILARMRLMVSEEYCPTHPLGNCEIMLGSEHQDGRNPDSDVERQLATDDLEEWVNLLNYCGTLQVSTKIFETGEASLDGHGGQVVSGCSASKESDNGLVRGVFYDIGTRGRSSKWRNPARRQVKVRWSTLDQMKVQVTNKNLKRDEAGHFEEELQRAAGMNALLDLPSRTAKKKFTSSQELPNQWISFDLGERRRLKLLAYALQHPSFEEGQLRHWKLQGSHTDSDSGLWVDLSTHTRDTSLEPDTAFATAMWGVAPTVSFRFFRLLMTDRNVESQNKLCLGAIEFYGELQELADGAVFDETQITESAGVDDSLNHFEQARATMIADADVDDEFHFEGKVYCQFNSKTTWYRLCLTVQYNELLLCNTPEAPRARSFDGDGKFKATLVGAKVSQPSTQRKGHPDTLRLDLSTKGTSSFSKILISTGGPHTLVKLTQVLENCTPSNNPGSNEPNLRESMRDSLSSGSVDAAEAMLRTTKAFDSQDLEGIE